MVGAIGVVAAVLVALAVWLGWRGADQSDSKAHAAAPPVAATVTARPSPTHLPDNDPVWKPNPGGEALFPANGKLATGSAVKLASKTDMIEVNVGGRKPGNNQTILTPDMATGQAGRPALRTDSLTNPPATSAVAPPPPTADETAPADAPVISTEQDGSATLNGVLSAKTTLPSFAGPVSQGVSGGNLVQHVMPIYPSQARTLRVEGKVVLSAMVAEDGRVGALKVVQGPALLANAAVDAVKRWRYEPFLLDGKPVKRETIITIDFKLPSTGH